MGSASTEHLEQLRQRLASFSVLPDEEWAHAARHYRECTFAAGTYLLQAGETTLHSHYICSGLVRVFYTRPDGREMNAAFVREGNVVGDYAANLRGSPAEFSIETLEPTTTLTLDVGFAESLLERHPAWAQLRKHLVDQLFLARRERERVLLTLSAEDRYRELIRRRPWIADRVPQHHIASHIGVTPVALSRIRRRLRERQ